MRQYPPQLSRDLIEHFKKIVGNDNPILLECYKARIMYGCEYPKEVEKRLDTIHEECWLAVGPPWWADLM